MAGKNDNKLFLYTTLSVECRAGHVIGEFGLQMPPHPRAGQIVIIGGFSKDEHDVYHADCPTCPHLFRGAARGSDQQINLDRVRLELEQLVNKGKHAGVIKV